MASDKPSDVTPPPPPDLSESSLGQIHRYHIRRELGRGAMGRVFLADDPRIDRKIALKIFQPAQMTEGSEENELRQRFLQEAKAAGRLSHTGIVTVFDADIDPKTKDPYLAMEWVDGRTLRDVLEAEGKMTVERAVDVAIQVADALDYAHRESVIHRDVKPENLMVRPDGKVKVTDFGIAKLRTTDLTVPGHILGSPSYMSPEQIKGLKVDGRSDLFALGLVLYECLTGDMAFGGDSLFNITYKIVSEQPEPAELKNPAIPEPLRQILTRAIEKSPDARYQTGADFADALRGILPPRPVTGPIDQNAATEEMRMPTGADLEARRATTSSQPIPGKPTVELGGQTVALGGETVATRALVNPSSAKFESKPPPKKKKRRSRVPKLLVLLLFLVAGVFTAWNLLLIPTPAPLKPYVPEPPWWPAAPASLPATPEWWPSAPLWWPPPPAPAEETPVVGTESAPTDTGSEQPPAELPFPTSEDPFPGLDDPADDPAMTPAAGDPGTAAGESTAPAEDAAILDVTYDNKIKAVYIALWVDGERKIYERLAGASFIQRRTVGQHFQKSVAVAPGVHDLEFRVTSVEGKDVNVSKRLKVNVESQQTLHLELKVDKQEGKYVLEVVRE